jgi:hypothetical protein
MALGPVPRDELRLFLVGLEEILACPVRASLKSASRSSLSLTHSGGNSDRGSLVMAASLVMIDR